MIRFFYLSGFNMTEKCFYNGDDDIDESCLQIDCNNRKTEEAMSKLSIETVENDTNTTLNDNTKSCSTKTS